MLIPEINGKSSTPAGEWAPTKGHIRHEPLLNGRLKGLPQDLGVVGRGGCDRRGGLKVQVELRVVVAREGAGLAAVEVPWGELLEPVRRGRGGWEGREAAASGTATCVGWHTSMLHRSSCPNSVATDTGRQAAGDKLPAAVDQRPPDTRQSVSRCKATRTCATCALLMVLLLSVMPGSISICEVLRGS